MFPYFKHKDKNSELIKNILKTIYFPPDFLGIDSFAIPFAKLKPNTKLKILLFTYGVIDAFCQAANLSNKDFDNICRNLDNFIEKTIGERIVSFISSKFYKDAFNNAKLLDIIKLGGKTYNDFASQDEVRGGQAITRLGSLVSMWDKL